jgi:UDP-N-acetylmuramyl-tripeptide synthetase
MRSDAAHVRAAGHWLRDHAQPGAQLRLDSRAIRAGDIFFAVPGRNTDGGRFVADACSRGAAAVVMDEAATDAPAGVPVLRVPGLADTAGWIAADFYDDPTGQLHTIGITGTNGKTTTCQWVAQLLGAFGRPCATIGTLGYGYAGALDAGESPLTTPDALSLQRLARRALDAGAGALALEASSIGLEQGRLQGVSVDIAVFTNLTRDHLDYHGDMPSYGAAKRRLFACPTLSHCVINLDDAFGAGLAADLRVRGLRVIGVSMAPAAAAAGAEAAAGRPGEFLLAGAVQHHAGGLRFTVTHLRAGAARTVPVETAVVGDFNVLNLLGVLGVALASGIALDAAAAALGRLAPPPGRLERVDAPGHQALPVVVVDYAHTPDAIDQALRAVRPLAQARGGRLWIVFGAGGDRDRGKRPAMAAAAAAAADVIVLTSDNPRGEDPAAIIADIAAGVPPGVRYEAIADRAAAIAEAVHRAEPADVLLVAGKGHEDYQEVGGRRLPFSDTAVARAALRARAGAPS